MPYLKQECRESIDRGDAPRQPGALNYAITKLILGYWKEHGNYQGINDIIGALENAKQEFYRRVAAPYEDTKIKENGDVF
jgi:hypothetical protein